MQKKAADVSPELKGSSIFLIGKNSLQHTHLMAFGVSGML